MMMMCARVCVCICMCSDDVFKVKSCKTNSNGIHPMVQMNNNLKKIHGRAVAFEIICKISWKCVVLK